MNIFLAGATGAIGSRLTPLLVAAGHSVTGTTRHANKAEAIRGVGAIPAIVDGLDAKAVLKAVEQAKPEVIIHELTAIPAKLNLRRFDEAFALTNRLRCEGTDNLLAAAQKVGCRRFIAQSYAVWVYAREGGWIKTEEAPLISTPEPSVRKSFEAIRHVEEAVLHDQRVGGIILRYGGLYGPGTSLGKGGSFLEDIRRRRMPIIGEGTGYWSFLHIEDAASATLAAVDAVDLGFYNICDDEPAPVSQWLPFLAHALEAKPPRRIPKWIGRMAIGPHGVAWMTEIRGASNRKAKSLLRWKLKWPSWRTGFLQGLENAIEKTAPRPVLLKAG